MGMTIGEKIIARAAKVDQVKAGEIHTIEVDRLMSNDGTTHLTIDMYHNQLKHPKIADKDKLVFIMDHNHTHKFQHHHQIRPNRKHTKYNCHNCNHSQYD